MENEAVLFKKMQAGDWSAFNLFFRGYMEGLYLYALAFVKERAVAEDIVQDTFIYLWVNRSRISYTGSVYAYLLQSVKNACINHKAHQEVEEKYRRVVVCADEAEDAGTDWEELRQKVMSAIDGLPPRCREIFILGAVEGMKYQEIAARLDISVNTVKTQMKYAYRKVKAEVGTEKDFMIVFAIVSTAFYS